eukprot:10019977-Lingulodinium_polyedra.AAC.1
MWLGLGLRGARDGHAWQAAKQAQARALGVGFSFSSCAAAATGTGPSGHHALLKGPKGQPKD